MSSPYIHERKQNLFISRKETETYLPKYDVQDKSKKFNIWSRNGLNMKKKCMIILVPWTGISVRLHWPGSAHVTHVY